MTVALYGHPFSSYTWKGRIALLAGDVEHELRIVDPDHPEHLEVIRSAGPLGKFPVLTDGDTQVFETTTIVEYVARHLAPSAKLLPEDPDAAIAMRMIDRVFDNYVMTPMQHVVGEYLRSPESLDATRVAQAREQLSRSYAWIESWLADYDAGDAITLIECAAAPSLFYADWVEEIGDARPKLKAYRARLLAHPVVARAVGEGRPYRNYFPLGAPDRD